MQASSTTPGEVASRAPSAPSASQGAPPSATCTLINAFSVEPSTVRRGPALHTCHRQPSRSTAVLPHTCVTHPCLEGGVLWPVAAVRHWDAQSSSSRGDRGVRPRAHGGAVGGSAQWIWALCGAAAGCGRGDGAGGDPAHATRRLRRWTPLQLAQRGTSERRPRSGVCPELRGERPARRHLLPAQRTARAGPARRGDIQMRGCAGGRARRDVSGVHKGALSRSPPRRHDYAARALAVPQVWAERAHGARSLAAHKVHREADGEVEVDSGCARAPPTSEPLPPRPKRAVMGL